MAVAETADTDSHWSDIPRRPEHYVTMPLVQILDDPEHAVYWSLAEPTVRGVFTIGYRVDGDEESHLHRSFNPESAYVRLIRNEDYESSRSLPERGWASVAGKVRQHEGRFLRGDGYFMEPHLIEPLEPRQVAAFNELY